MLPARTPATASPGRRLLLGLALALGLFAVGMASWWQPPADWPWPDASWLLLRQAELRSLQADGPWAFAGGLFLLLTLLSALALPGCSVLALAAGMAMGWLPGTALVVLASTVGATLSFLAARHLWRDSLHRRWGHRLVRVQAGLARDGAFYLFSLRLAPVIPYALINPLMGMSAMPTRQFFGVSLLGMLAGSAAYVYAGTALGQAGGWHDLASPSLWAGLLLLAGLPWAARWGWRWKKRRAGQHAATARAGRSR